MRLNNFAVGFFLFFAIAMPISMVLIYLLENNFALSNFQINALKIIIMLIVVAIPPILAFSVGKSGQNKLEEFGEPVGNLIRVLNFKTVSLSTLIIILAVVIAVFSK